MHHVESLNQCFLNGVVRFEMNVKALIFDCDGTLTDTMGMHYSAWRRSLLLRGVELTEDDFYSQSGTPSSRVIPEVASRAGVEIDFPSALADKERLFLDELHALSSVEAVVAIAAMFRGRLPMAVASGGTRRLVEQQLKQAQIDSWFDAVVTCEDTERHKPDPDVFLEAARRLGVEANRCCVFEDGEPGIVAANRAGMLCVDVRPYRHLTDVESAMQSMLAQFEVEVS